MQNSENSIQKVIDEATSLKMKLNLFENKNTYTLQKLFNDKIMQARTKPPNIFSILDTNKLNTFKNGGLIYG